jgi:hypothetical protein
MGGCSLFAEAAAQVQESDFILVASFRTARESLHRYESSPEQIKS